MFLEGLSYNKQVGFATYQNQIYRTSVLSGYKPCFLSESLILNAPNDASSSMTTNPKGVY